jgi:hypothetical protein
LGFKKEIFEGKELKRETLDREDIKGVVYTNLMNIFRLHSATCSCIVELKPDHFHGFFPNLGYFADFLNIQYHYERSRA